MQQKYKVLSFAIVTALYIFSVPTTSHASNFKITKTPRETVGANARAPISCGNPGYNCTPKECVYKLVLADYKWRRTESPNERRKRASRGGRQFKVGLGYVIRYIQSTGGYCYYYKGGYSNGKSGPNTWRYDPK